MKIFIILIILFLFNKYAYSEDLFDTSFYDVNFVSNNIDNTKLTKINYIKKESLINILNKTLNNKEFEKLKPVLSKDLINSFIKNIIINEEKIVGNKYFSKIKINFNKNNFY